MKMSQFLIAFRASLLFLICTGTLIKDTSVLCQTAELAENSNKKAPIYRVKRNEFQEKKEDVISEASTFPPKFLVKTESPKDISSFTVVFNNKSLNFPPFNNETNLTDSNDASIIVTDTSILATDASKKNKLRDSLDNCKECGQERNEASAYVSYVLVGLFCAAVIAFVVYIFYLYCDIKTCKRRTSAETEYLFHKTHQKIGRTLLCMKKKESRSVAIETIEESDFGLITHQIEDANLADTRQESEDAEILRQIEEAEIRDQPSCSGINTGTAASTWGTTAAEVYHRNTTSSSSSDDGSKPIIPEDQIRHEVPMQESNVSDKGKGLAGKKTILKHSTPGNVSTSKSNNDVKNEAIVEENPTNDEEKPKPTEEKEGCSEGADNAEENIPLLEINQHNTETVPIQSQDETSDAHKETAAE